jgi:hypothetical protein
MDWWKSVVTKLPVAWAWCTPNLLGMRGCAGSREACSRTAQLAAPRHMQADVHAGRAEYKVPVRNGSRGDEAT